MFVWAFSKDHSAEKLTESKEETVYWKCCSEENVTMSVRGKWFCEFNYWFCIVKPLFLLPSIVINVKKSLQLRDEIWKPNWRLWKSDPNVIINLPLCVLGKHEKNSFCHMISISVLSFWPQTLQGHPKKREVGWCRCQSKIKGQQAVFKD